MQGIRTLVAVNDPELVSRYAADAASESELWVDYPDDIPPLKAKFPGDPRAALAPWLAHKVPMVELLTVNPSAAFFGSLLGAAHLMHQRDLLIDALHFTLNAPAFDQP